MKMNEILLYINNSEYIRGWLKTICKDIDLREDLFQHCLLEISREDINKLYKLYNKKHLDKYFIQIMRFQYKSTSSSFFKEYINNGFWDKDFIKGIGFGDLKDNDYIDNEYLEINKDIKNKMLVVLIDNLLLKTDPLKVSLFKMKYYEGKSYNEISEYYGINYQVIRNKIIDVRKFVIDNIKKHK